MLQCAYRVGRLPDRAFRRATHAVIDRILGVETANEVRLAELGLDDRHRVSYQPSGWLDVRRVLHPSDVSPDDVFLDLGAGKGRIVMAAARYPFRRIIGVDVSERLLAVARRNVENGRTRLRCQDIELVHADVAEFRIPDDVTVVYMYHPFRGPVFASVIAGLIESVDRSPRQVRVIYRNACEHEQLMKTGRFLLLRLLRGVPPMPHRAIRLYLLDPIGNERHGDSRASSGRSDIRATEVQQAAA